MHLLPKVLLVLVLAAGGGLSIDVNRLTEVMEAIKNKFQINNQRCVVANIPVNSDPDALNDALQNAIYARPRKKHAEVHVLTSEKFLKMIKDEKPGYFLLIYSFLSPCSQCTDPNGQNNIIDSLEKVKNGVFVFTQVYDKCRNPEVISTGDSGHNQDENHYKISKDNLRTYLRRLAGSIGGLSRVYRCFGEESQFRCYSCSSNVDGIPADVCVVNNFVPGQEGAVVGRNEGQQIGY